MSDYSYNLWKLHELTSSDPRMYLDIILIKKTIKTILSSLRSQNYFLSGWQKGFLLIERFLLIITNNF